MARAQIVSNFLSGLVDDDWIFDNLTKAVRTSRKTGFRPELGHALWWWYAIEAEEFELAGRFLGRAEAHDLGGPRQDELPRYREQLETALGDRLAALVEEGAGLTDDEAVEALLEWAKQ